MSTPKEIFLELIKPDGQPERQLRQYEALHMCLDDPINTYLRGNRKRGTVSVDRWGTTISFPQDAPGPMPVHGEGVTVCPDITRWRETVMHLILTRPALPGGTPAESTPRSPKPRAGCLPGSWARAYSSGAISSWALRTRLQTCTSTRTRCTSL